MSCQVDAREHLRLLEKWLKFSRIDIHVPLERDDLMCYGTGYDSWGVQTNQKALAAWAIAGSAVELDEKTAGFSREDISEIALRMLRFSLESHKVGSFECLDGAKWGNTWISALGIERMMHAVDALEPRLTADDKALMRKLLLSEADWLMDDYEIVADPDGRSGKNRPESNLWNGALLHRVAFMYPDVPRAAEYRRRGTKYLLNSISVPSDADRDEAYDGAPLSEWHVGANFFDSFALHHHAYLNVGYMVICLSNIAMLHFSFKAKGVRSPDALHHNAEKLWSLIKECTFPDGRLCRIGGDTRARYCYCQDYALPMWLYVADRFGDEECLAFERGWLDILKTETAANGDGSFLGERGGTLKMKSPLYYTRLESDRAVTLSMAYYWRSLGVADVVSPNAAGQASRNKGISSAGSIFTWSDEFHGACLRRGSDGIASWVWEAAEKPQGLCVPLNKSDMAEWRSNLFPNIAGTGAKNENVVRSHSERLFDGGFLTWGNAETVTSELLAEGRGSEVVANQSVAFAALPDGRSCVCVQYAEAPRRVYIETVQGVNLNMPNDIFNDRVRAYLHAAGTFETTSLPAEEETLRLNSNWLLVDDSLFVETLYGGDLAIHRSNKREICIRGKSRGGGFLYVDEISSPFINGLRAWEKGEIFVDVAFVVRTGGSTDSANFHMDAEMSGDGAEKSRFVAVRAADGRTYALLANFADGDAAAAVSAGKSASAVDVATGKLFENRDGAIRLCCGPRSCVLAEFADVDD